LYIGGCFPRESLLCLDGFEDLGRESTFQNSFLDLKTQGPAFT